MIWHLQTDRQNLVFQKGAVLNHSAYLVCRPLPYVRSVPRNGGRVVVAEDGFVAVDQRPQPAADQRSRVAHDGARGVACLAVDCREGGRRLEEAGSKSASTRYILE